MDELANFKGMRSVDIKPIKAYGGEDTGVCLKAKLDVPDQVAKMWRHCTLDDGEIKYPESVVRNTFGACTHCHSYTHAHMHACTHARTHPYTHTHTRMHARIHAYTHTTHTPPSLTHAHAYTHKEECMYSLAHMHAGTTPNTNTTPQHTSHKNIHICIHT